MSHRCLSWKTRACIGTKVCLSPQADVDLCLLCRVRSCFPRVCPTVLPFLLICKRDKKKKKNESVFIVRVFFLLLHAAVKRSIGKMKRKRCCCTIFSVGSFHSQGDTQNTAGPQQ
jgi:hypothetical protein